MEIRRSGLRRSVYWSTLVAESDSAPYPQKVRWDKWFNVDEGDYVKGVSILKTDVSDLNRSDKHSQYQYEVWLTSQDIAAIIEVLANSGVEEMPDEIRESFKDSTVSLLRLALCAQGQSLGSSEGKTENNP